MAFNINAYSRISGSANNDIITASDGTALGAPCVYSYISFNDTIATISAADYFNPLASVLNVGDLLYIVGSDANNFFTVATLSVQPPHVTVSTGVVTGDVSGPGSSTNNDFALFNGATGKIIKDAGYSIVPATSGGTGQSTYILGDTLYASAANTLSKLAGNITSAKQYLSQTGTGVVSAAPAWATISGGDITGAALTKTDDTNVTLTLGGTPATALLRAASLTLGWTGQLSLARGGSNADLSGTVSNGGIVYSTATAMAILAGTATANQVLLSGSSTTPAWSTATYPATTAINQILYSSSANVVAGLATANDGVLTTGATGIPVITALGADGQLIIGSSAGAPLAATISAGTGVTVTNGHNSITIAATAAGSNWVDQTSTPVTMAANTSYVADNAGLVTLNMPAIAAFGSVFTIVGQGAGGWLLQMNTGQTGHLNSSATTVAGSFASTERYDAITLVCTVANTTFVAVSSSGVITNA